MKTLLTSPLPSPAPTSEELQEARAKAAKAHIEYEDKFEAGTTDDHTMLDIADTAICAMADLIELYFEALCHLCDDAVAANTDETEADWEVAKAKKRYIN